MSETRAAIIYCPYCGDEDLHPAEQGWSCRSCLRVFTVRMLGLAPRPGTPATSTSSQAVTDIPGATR